MKKLLLLMIIFLVGCTQTGGTGQQAVYINFKEVPAITQEETVYIPIDALEALDMEILRDLEKHRIYISKTEELGSVSNDRPYNWYVDQGDTGTHAGNNCGPSSVVMASLWQDVNFDYSAEEARLQFRSFGGWWYTDDISAFFEKHNISYDIEDYDGSYELVNTLNAGHIILLCVDTTYIEDQDDEDSFIGKFYDYDGGHFLIVKGYMYLEGELFFEVYDPNCWGETYSDGSPKGKDRLYPADELDDAIEVWWDNYFIIENK